MDLIDIVILILVVAGCIIGYIKGLVAQISTIAGIVLGIIACNLWGDWATQVLVKIVPEAANWPEPQYTTAAIACIVLFLLIFLGIQVAGAVFKSIAKKLMLGVIDRLAGAVFCVFKFLLVVSIVLNVWYLFSPGSSLFTKQHAMGNVPFSITINLAPRLFGIDSLPQLLDDLQQIQPQEEEDTK